MTSANGTEWAEVVAQHNSGTYNKCVGLGLRCSWHALIHTHTHSPQPSTCPTASYKLLYCIVSIPERKPS